MAKKNRGREVIDILKVAYSDGVVFEGASALRTYVMEQGKFKTRELYSLTTWERQARYELAREERVSVTNPTRGNNYTRNPNASSRERVASRTKLLKDFGTRFDNIGTLITVDSEQVDASRVEIERAAKLGVLKEVWATVQRELEKV